MANGRFNRGTAVLEPPVRNGHRIAKGPERAELEAIVAAIGKSQAVIEFRMDGTILTANENFLNAMGYALEEIKGQHHSMFVDAGYARGSEYREFWAKLNRGEYQSAEYKRFGKGGREVWIQASYNPIFDSSGKPFKIVKYATDVTEQKLANADYTGQIAAIGKSQAVIEFRMDGTILTANDNFLKTLGYSLDEIKGKHHSLFVDEAYKQSSEYKEFWARLNRGEYQTAEYKRFGKGGKEVWIQASYNPILDLNGKPFKVVKYATEVTEQKLVDADYTGQIAAIGKSQAVIEFRMDGTILTANDNFLKTLGYSLDEIKGKHHSLFVDEAYKQSSEYKEFWARLNRGEYQTAEYKRFGKGGKEVWIQASYNPILDLNGKPFKVVKYATEVTEQKLVDADYTGQIAAIGKSQAVIEFRMDGTILTANDNFLKTLGYSLDEIKGKHHSLFVDEAYKQSSEYKEFWARLNRGEYQTAEYKRFGKGGKEVWIQASYNPILDLNGKPFKVVKYASDITAEVAKRHEIAILSLVANETDNSVIITDRNELIEYTNPGFTKMTGYTFEEVKGKRPGDVLQGKSTSAESKQQIRDAVKHRKSFYTEILNYAKNGESYWVSLAVNPVFGGDGQIERFISIQSNVTSTKEKALESSMQLDAISRALAFIEFRMDGTIVTANENFLKTLGYTLDEIKGKHHSLFVDEAYKQSSEYKEFWSKLNRGEYQTAEYKRFGKSGKEVWIQASYNPILDMNGKPFKVVKYATDVTEQVKAKIDMQKKVDIILGVVKAASHGDLTQELTVSGSDAVGQMGEGLTAFFKALRHSIQQILQNAQSVGASSEELTAISQQMAGNAEETATQAKVVSGASGEVSKSVSIVATGGEQMLESIREIAKNSNESARVAKNAVVVADTANQTISKLGESSVEIGKVIKVITSIAQQTNLLALNATIEAARAGEAGKGFAVVANEVKELAKETAKATEEIGRKIDAIQSDTTSAVQAIGEIGSIINQISDISNSIASAVEEQTATTNEMGRNISEAARGAGEITNNISGVAEAAQNTTSGANDTQAAAKALSEMASQLQTLVGRFKI